MSLLLAAYLLFVTVAGLASVANTRRGGRYSDAVLRTLTGCVAIIAGGVAVILLAADGDQTTQAVVLPAAILLGSLSYLAGLVIWRGGVALALRVLGWILLVLPALLPSTLSLALPVLGLLALTIWAPEPGSDRASPVTG